MTTRITRITSPEAKELEKKKAELASLEARLAERELDLATLQAELHSFEGTYLRIVGSRLAELDEIEAQIAEVGARNKRVAQSLCSSNSAALFLMNVHSLVTCGLDAVRRILFSLNVTHHDRAWSAKSKEPQSF